MDIRFPGQVQPGRRRGIAGIQVSEFAIDAVQYRASARPIKTAGIMYALGGEEQSCTRWRYGPVPKWNTSSQLVQMYLRTHVDELDQRREGQDSCKLLCPLGDVRKSQEMQLHSIAAGCTCPVRLNLQFNWIGVHVEGCW